MLIFRASIIWRPLSGLWLSTFYTAIYTIDSIADAESSNDESQTQSLQLIATHISKIMARLESNKKKIAELQAENQAVRNENQELHTRLENLTTPTSMSGGTDTGIQSTMTENQRR